MELKAKVPGPRTIMQGPVPPQSVEEESPGHLLGTCGTLRDLAKQIPRQEGWCPVSPLTGSPEPEAEG
jgi:hypothetical protein